MPAPTTATGRAGGGGAAHGVAGKGPARSKGPMTIAPARRMTLAMFFALLMFAISLSLLAALVLVNVPANSSTR